MDTLIRILLHLITAQEKEGIKVPTESQVIDIIKVSKDKED